MSAIHPSPTPTITILSIELSTLETITWFQNVKQTLSAMGLEGPYDLKSARGKKRTATATTTIRNRLSPELNRSTEDLTNPDDLIDALS